jgi:hypothetical protein
MDTTIQKLERLDTLMLPYKEMRRRHATEVLV